MSLDCPRSDEDSVQSRPSPLLSPSPSSRSGRASLLSKTSRPRADASAGLIHLRGRRQRRAVRRPRARGRRDDRPASSWQRGGAPAHDCPRCGRSRQSPACTDRYWRSSNATTRTLAIRMLAVPGKASALPMGCWRLLLGATTSDGLIGAAEIRTPAFRRSARARGIVRSWRRPRCRQGGVRRVLPRERDRQPDDVCRVQLPQQCLCRRARRRKAQPLLRLVQLGRDPRAGPGVCSVT